MIQADGYYVKTAKDAQSKGREIMTLEIHNGIAEIPSSRKRGVRYQVSYSHLFKRWMCNCPDFRYRRMDDMTNCKHIDYYLNLLETASTEELENVVIYN